MDEQDPRESSNEPNRCAMCGTGIASIAGGCCAKCWEKERLIYDAVYRGHLARNGKPVSSQPANDSPLDQRRDSGTQERRETHEDTGTQERRETQEDTGTQERRETQEDTGTQERRDSTHPGNESSKSPKSSVSEFLRAVFEAAMTKPLPPAASRYYLPKMRVLVALCAELQIAAGEGAFFLTCRDAGNLIGEDFRKALGWLKRLELDGLLLRVATGSKASHKGNEYRFLA